MPFSGITTDPAAAAAAAAAVHAVRQGTLRGCLHLQRFARSHVVKRSHSSEAEEYRLPGKLNRSGSFESTDTTLPWFMCAYD
jgi:hypothetical protein